MPPTHAPGSEDVSVFSAVFNHEDTVSDTIESVLAQKTRFRLHHYFFNDCSTDGSAAVLERYREKYPDRITVFTNPRNLGSGKKSFLHQRPKAGEFWTLLAGDDFWTANDKIERQIDLLKQTPAAVGCSTHTVVRNEQTKDEQIIAPRMQRWNLMDMLVNKRGLYVHPSSIVWRNVHQDSGHFLPPEYIQSERAGDALLLHMMLLQGHEMVNLPDVTSCYRVTGQGVWTSLTKKAQRAENRKIRRHITSRLPFKYRLARYLYLSGLAGAFSLPKPVFGRLPKGAGSV